MPVTITYRLSEDDKAREVSLEEIKTHIAAGKIGPKALVFDRVLTNNEWWTFDDLNIFHKNSPADHPPGDRLRKKREVEEHRNEAQKRSWTMLAAYMEGSLIDERYNLTALPEISRQQGDVTVARLYVLRSFDAESIFTFSFDSKNISVEAVCGATSLWRSIPQVGSTNGMWKETVSTPFEASHIMRSVVALDLAQAPEIFHQWEGIEEVVRLAPNCTTAALDGVGYRHQFFSANGLQAAEWRNPDPVRHAAQTKLIEAYRELVKLAGLNRFWERSAS